MTWNGSEPYHGLAGWGSNPPLNGCGESAYLSTTGDTGLDPGTGGEPEPNQPNQREHAPHVEAPAWIRRRAVLLQEILSVIEEARL